MKTPAFRLVRRPATDDGPPPVLDERQQAVVAHTGGPLLVVGGPGTGKTTALVEAVAARVAGGVDPERVLVLTFGRRAAGRLRDRVARRVTTLGGTTRAVPEPLVRTFHAYAFGLLRRAAARRGEPAPRLLTGPEQDVVIRQLLAGDPQRWPERLQAAIPTRAFAGQLRDLLLRAAERGIDAALLEELGAKLGREDWRAAAGFRSEYDAVLALRDATTGSGTGYDYAELVRAAAGLLSDQPALLAAERRRLAMVYVDEFADTDPAQRDLLELVAGRGAPLVGFADPDSSTFGFRGADPDGVRDFPDRFPTAAGAPARSLTLTRSYRAGGGLLAAAARVSRRLRGPAQHRDQAPAHPEAAGLVQVHTFHSAVSEHAWLAHRLREIHLRESVPWSRMAVLVRAGRQLARVQRALHTARVPAVVHAEDLPLSAQPAVAPLLRLLRCALDPSQLDEEAAVWLLHSPLGGADPFTERALRQGLRALARSDGDHRPSGDLLVEALRDPAELTMVDRRWVAPAKSVAGLLQVARDAAAQPAATAEDVLWKVWRASGLADRWSAAARAPADEGSRAEAADRDLDAVVALFDAAARFVDRLPGARVEVFLDHVQGQQLPADSLAPTADRGEAVRLLTAHAAKGLEWDVVAIPGVQEGVWPDLRLRGSLLGSEQLVDVHAGRDVGVVGQISALLAEERRLFYVAVTRARRHLLVSAVAAASVGEGEQTEQPSRFLRELTGQDLPEESGDDPGGIDESGAVPRGLTLPALVAELRTAVADPAGGFARRQAAAAQLARLAEAGVRGAHPDQWWGLAPLSDDRPLVDDSEPVRVTPSAMESALRCSLRWLLERHGGAAPATAAQGVGNLVHATAMLADRASVDREALLDWLDGRFDAIEHAARWLAGPERERAEAMVDKLVRWVTGNPRRLLAIEQDFVVELGQVQLRGRVDRLELDEAGRLVVVDLKTGKAAPTGEQIAAHPQLGAYQAAVEAGAFAEHGVEPGGASLVQLGTPTREAKEQVQPPLVAADDPGWAAALVRRTGQVMAAASFAAVRNDRCRVCPVRTSCPITGQGRQVVQP
ncbi:MAG: AAA family ATPase [Micromonosporaceae bacterium]|nr:AAA family ATPase [Micromonosporaceae bacterium]